MDVMGVSQMSISSQQRSHGQPYEGPQLASRGDQEGQGAHEGQRDDAGLPEERYLDREESMLRFNERVLELAEDESVPLLERVRFLAIFANNLDEFFMVRVAGLVRRMVAGFPVEGTGVRMPRQVLGNTLELAGELTVRHARAFSERILPELASHGIEILRWKELSADERDRLSELFRQRIYPVLTPLVVDPAHPFPFISGLSLNLAVMIADPRTDATVFARVKVPPLLPRFLAVSQNRYVPIEDVIAAHMADLFGGVEVLEHHVFRVTRIRDLEVDEDLTENLLQAMERELVRRRFEPAVRLEVEETMSGDVLERLVTELDIDARAVYRVPGPLDLSGLFAIADLNIGELRYPAFVPSSLAVSQDGSIFTTIAERDILVQHPYDSFAASVERLIEEAAEDPGVLAIKQTLYRTSGKSPIVDALIEAAEAGKQVVVVVEIKARFDERANIAWARKLEEAGCHVVYGFVGLKTHCKMALIVRQEADGTLRRYCHLGTGNYHPTTARVYEDFGLLTADPVVGEDVTALFNHLTGYSRPGSHRRLLVAPESLRNGIVSRIDRQAERQRAGLPARVVFKCNALVDEAVMDALYRASQAGVPVDLWIRSICALRPGITGLSDNIRVRSVVGRFLEHSRIYAFGVGEDEDSQVWIGSADMMHRNLDRRVELLVQVADPGHQRRLRGLLDLGLDDSTSSWWLRPDGYWTRHNLDGSGNPLRDIQETLVSQRRARSADESGLRRGQRRPPGARPGGDPDPVSEAILAAGAVVWRPAADEADEVEVLLVHRPKYDDWSLPKGKREPGEHVLLTAVREVHEETSVRPVLGPRLRRVEYVVSGRPKQVDYWSALAAGDRAAASHEVDAVAWLPWPHERGRLSYPHDADVIASLRPRRTVPLILVRHASAGQKGSLPGDDLLRPLDAEGAADAVLLADLLACFAPTARVISSAALRCIQTVRPYAAAFGGSVEAEAALAVPGGDGDNPFDRTDQAGRVRRLIRGLVTAAEPTVVCLHRENLPIALAAACSALGARPAATDPGAWLPKGAFYVVHVAAGEMAGLERYEL
jgi:polyphosphate kinase